MSGSFQVVMQDVRVAPACLLLTVDLLAQIVCSLHKLRLDGSLRPVKLLPSILLALTAFLVERLKNSKGTSHFHLVQAFVVSRVETL